MTFKTREDWLKAATDLLQKKVEAHGKLPKKLHFLCSWAYGSKTAIGSTYGTAWTKDKSTYISISPVLDDPLQVLATLVHELIHAIMPDVNHGPLFKKAALACGLEGKMRATHAGEELVEELKKMSKTLGAYPHEKMMPASKDGKPEPKKGKAQVRYESPVDEKYAVWITPVQVEAHGAPICPISKQPMVATGGGEGEENED